MGIHKIKSVFRLTLGLLAVFIAVYALAQGNQQERLFQGGTLPEADGFVHMGVATCASSVCHGQPSASEQDNVLMTEYRTWLNQDLHSRAYNSLLTPASRLIARTIADLQESQKIRENDLLEAIGYRKCQLNRSILR